MAYNASRYFAWRTSAVRVLFPSHDGIRRTAGPMMHRLRQAHTSSKHPIGSEEYLKELFPLDRQTYILPGEERIRMSRFNELAHSKDQYYSDVTTMYEGFLRGKRISNDGNFLGYRPNDDKQYKWLTFSQVEEKATLFGSGLVALGNQPGGDSFVGIFAQNRPEWVIADVACMQYSLVSVPFFNTISSQSGDVIITQTSMSTIICDTMEKADRLRRDHASHECLTTVVVMDLPREGIEEHRAQFERDGLKLVSFDEVIALGGKNVVDKVLPKPETINTLVYTSGTTGIPKGVIQTHKNHIAAHANAWMLCSLNVLPRLDDVHISYLPLPHVYERGNLHTLMIGGAPLGFFRGDPLKLVDDIQTLRPTLMGGVPRVFNRIYDRVMSTVNASNVVRRNIFKLAYSQKLKALDRGISGKDTIWDKLVFSRMQNMLGGRMRLIASGAAPLAPEIAAFLRVSMGCHFVEAYGQTESTFSLTHNVEHDLTCGHVGIPGGDCQLKLIDVPELNYYAKNDQGEVCARGSSIFSGYFKDPERTKEVLDSDGWLHTGDIGQWNKNGTLSVIDRKRNIFKLSQGVFVAPEKVENVYLREPLLAQVFVTGNGLWDSIVGIAIPDKEELEKFAKQNNIPGTFEDLCQNKIVKEAILTRMQKQAKSSGLASFEQVKNIHLHSELFSESNGLQTPTMKNKRNVIEKIFAEEIAQIYEESK
ncbi:long-chain-fatty-acid--CoA ligase 5-like [Diadema antillarum]|uniref:long-chain-fatty-acid--CoA ligase 5-like n=1 Tax=Diadema antillarum TaxID=105358 RepID=UPI003A8A7378